MQGVQTDQVLACCVQATTQGKDQAQRWLESERLAHRAAMEQLRAENEPWTHRKPQEKLYCAVQPEYLGPSLIYGVPILTFPTYPACSTTCKCKHN